MRPQQPSRSDATHARTRGEGMEGAEGGMHAEAAARGAMQMNIIKLNKSKPQNIKIGTSTPRGARAPTHTRIQDPRHPGLTPA